MSGAAIVSAFRNEISRQKRTVEEASIAQTRLKFVVSAMRLLSSDAHFVTLLRAEGMPTAPKVLLDRLDIEPDDDDRA